MLCSVYQYTIYIITIYYLNTVEYIIQHISTSIYRWVNTIFHTVNIEYRPYRMPTTIWLVYTRIPYIDACWPADGRGNRTARRAGTPASRASRRRSTTTAARSIPTRCSRARWTRSTAWIGQQRSATEKSVFASIRGGKCSIRGNFVFLYLILKRWIFFFQKIWF